MIDRNEILKRAIARALEAHASKQPPFAGSAWSDPVQMEDGSRYVFHITGGAVDHVLLLDAPYAARAAGMKNGAYVKPATRRSRR